MTGDILTLVLAVSLGLAPVPAEPPPDPLAWGYLGVKVTTGTLRVSSVEPNTPASRAGLQAEDELVQVGTIRPRTFDEVAEHIAAFRPGTLMRVEVRRNGEIKAYTVRLGVRPNDLPPPPQRNRPPLPIPEP